MSSTKSRPLVQDMILLPGILLFAPLFWQEPDKCVNQLILKNAEQSPTLRALTVAPLELELLKCEIVAMNAQSA